MYCPNLLELLEVSICLKHLGGTPLRNKSLRVQRWIVALLIVVAVTLFLLNNWVFSAIPSLPTKWTLKVSSADTVYIQDSVAVAGSTVYVVSKDINPTKDSTEEIDYLRAVDTETGKERWKFSFSAARETEPAVADGIIYFGGCGGPCYFYAVDANTGSLLWKTPAGDYRQEVTSPVVANGLAYFGTRPVYGENQLDMFLYAVDATTGKEVWKLKVEGGVSVYSIGGGIFYYGNLSQPTSELNSTYLRAVDSATGREIWTFKTPDQASTPPQIANENVYFTTSQYGRGDALYALDKNTGREKWYFHLGRTTLSPPIIINRELHVGVNEQRQDCIDNCPPPPAYTDYLYSLDSITGEEMSKVQTRAPIAGRAILDDGLIYSVDFHGNLYAQDVRTGETKWKFETHSYPGVSPVMSDRVIYIGSWYAHDLYAIAMPTIVQTRGPTP